MRTKKTRKFRVSDLVGERLIRVEDKLIARYKEKNYSATVLQDGLQVKGKRYRTPSEAGCAITGNITCDGWMFWKREDAKTGRLVTLAEIRKRLTGDLRQYKKTTRKSQGGRKA